MGLHEAVGFEALGVYRDVGYKLSAWHDVGWWRLGLADDDKPPSEPMTFAQLRKTPAFRRLLE